MSKLSIIAIHGNGGGGFRFQRTLEYFSNYDVRFVAPTLPGFADKPKDPSLKTLGDYAHVIKDYIEAEKRPRVMLGHGIGGSMGLEVCKEFPNLLDGIILHSPVGALLDKRLFPKIMKVPGVARLGRAIFTSTILRSHYIEKMFTHHVPRNYLDQFFKEYERCSVFEDMFRLIDYQWFSSLKPMDVRACILWGQHDFLSENHAEEFEKLLPNSWSEKVASWTHWPMIEVPQHYAKVVTEIAHELTSESFEP